MAEVESLRRRSGSLHGLCDRPEPFPDTPQASPFKEDSAGTWGCKDILFLSSATASL